MRVKKDLKELLICILKNKKARQRLKQQGFNPITQSQ